MNSSNLELMPILLKILSVKYRQSSYRILHYYYAYLAKLKLRTIEIQSISVELFNELILQNDYKYDFFGDFQSCGLLSLNTLVALSVSNKSWLRVKNFTIDEKPQNSVLKISVPSVQSANSNGAKSYLIKCYCVSNLKRDFVMYVTETLMFNLLQEWQCRKLTSGVIGKINVELNHENFPTIAEFAVVSGITTENDITFKDFDDVLHEYFKTPRLLKRGGLFSVSLADCSDELRCRASLCNLRELHFLVSKVSGSEYTNRQEFYVSKECTSLHLNPSEHSYLPSHTQMFIKSFDLPGYEIPYCPDGLKKYHDKITKIFKMFIKGVDISGMLLLSGPKGSGKMVTIKSVASSFGFNLLHENCFDFYGLNPKQMNGKLDQIFSKARRTIPCVLFFENVELIGREQNYHENMRFIDMFQSEIKELQSRKSNLYPLIVVGATHQEPSEIIPAIGRLFVHTIYFESPNAEETYKTLNWAVKYSNMICSKNDLKSAVEKVKGYIFSDLVLLVQHAIRFQVQDYNSSKALRRVIELTHLNKAIGVMEAAYSESIKAAKVPSVHWDDVGGLNDLKEEITESLSFPLKHPEFFSSGLKRSGILFYGPPGTGKTLMAKAVATECNYNFFSVKGPELMNMYVGQSEKNVREVFERARDAAPCIIFFDELDSLAPSRGKSGDSGGVSDRVVSQLLAEMDGLDKNKDVFVIAATNRPDLVDPALLRPGRFDKMFYVGVCNDKESKLSVLKALTKRFSLSSDVDFEEIIEELPAQVTGADLYSVCSNAWFAAVRKAVKDLDTGLEVTLPLEVSSGHFVEAIQQFVPSLSDEDIEYYEKINSLKKEGSTLYLGKKGGNAA